MISCGYPDIDKVPEFKDIKFSDEEIEAYCNNIYRDKNNQFKNVTECIIDYYIGK